LNVLGIHNSITGEKGAANGALEKMAIGRLLVSVSTPPPPVPPPSTDGRRASRTRSSAWSRKVWGLLVACGEW